MRSARAAVALVLASLAGACARAQGPATAPSPAVTMRADTARLHRTLDSLAAAHHGVVGYSVTNLETGEHLERRGDETFPTASLIKVPVLVTLYDLVEQQKISLDDRMVLLAIDKVPGSGTLQFMHDGIEVTVGDAAYLMSTISDNTATNMLLDRVAIRRVWDKMEALGLPHTKVHSRTFQRFTSLAMDSSAKYGLGVTTPNEMAHLFALLAAGRAVSPRADSLMLATLEQNQDLEQMQRFLVGVRAAHKTGATDEVRTECSLFYLPARVVACALTKENQDQRWVVDNEAQVTLARIGQAVVGAWTPPAAAKAP